jgi:hypothetical protein
MEAGINEKAVNDSDGRRAEFVAGFKTALGILKKERENTESPKFPYFTAFSATAFAPRGRFRKQLRSTNDV